MRVDEVVNHMTKWYLDRIVDSFTKDFPRLDEDRAREIIVKNVDELTDAERVRKQLSFDGYRYSERVLQTYVLEYLLACPEHMADESSVIAGVSEKEEAVVAAAADPESLRYDDPEAVDILESVLGVAVEDDHLSRGEIQLIDRLRRKLRIGERSQRILLARLGHFPAPGNEIHAPSEFREALNDLQRRGVVFYANRLNGGSYLIPDEIVPAVKQAVGVELCERPWRLLLSNLSQDHLRTILGSAGVPRSGSKEEQMERVIAIGIQPTQALEALSNQELYDVCRSLPGVHVGGSKADRIERIIEHFAKLVVREVPAEASPGERYCEYLVELAHRDRENLLTNRVITKGQEMEAAFEEGLRYLFETRLGLEPTPISGRDHPDGVFAFDNGALFMWHAQSKEDVYTLPASHLKQFKRYIRDSATRVSCFMVVVPELAPGAEDMAARLKVESNSDTDVALITAENLLWVARRWAARGTADPINLEVFNITGVLDRHRLTHRLKLFP